MSGKEVAPSLQLPTITILGLTDEASVPILSGHIYCDQHTSAAVDYDRSVPARKPRKVTFDLPPSTPSSLSQFSDDFVGQQWSDLSTDEQLKLQQKEICELEEFELLEQYAQRSPLTSDSLLIRRVDDHLPELPPMQQGHRSPQHRNVGRIGRKLAKIREASPSKLPDSVNDSVGTVDEEFYDSLVVDSRARDSNNVLSAPNQFDDREEWSNYQQQEKFDRYREEEIKKLKKERKLLEMHRQSAAQLPSKKERDQMEKLRCELEETHRLMAQKESQWSAAVSRYKQQILSLERQNEELLSDLRLLEKRRLEEWQQLMAPGKRTDVSTAGDWHATARATEKPAPHSSREAASDDTQASSHNNRVKALESVKRPAVSTASTKRVKQSGAQSGPSKASAAPVSVKKPESKPMFRKGSKPPALKKDSKAPVSHKMESNSTDRNSETVPSDAEDIPSDDYDGDLDSSDAAWQLDEFVDAVVIQGPELEDSSGSSDSNSAAVDRISARVDGNVDSHFPDMEERSEGSKTAKPLAAKGRKSVSCEPKTVEHSAEEPVSSDHKVREFAQKFRQIRMHLHLTQKNLSIQTGLSQSSISKFECQSADLTPQRAASIKNHLATWLDDLDV